MITARSDFGIWWNDCGLAKNNGGCVSMSPPLTAKLSFPTQFPLPRPHLGSEEYADVKASGEFRHPAAGV